MTYAIYITDELDPDPTKTIWFQPSELKDSFNDFEPTLNHAIKAERFYQRMLGLKTKRELI